MKKYLIVLALMVVLIFTTALNSNKPSPMHSIEGTWELVSFYFYENDEISDTVPKGEAYRQVKMYYNGKIMWSRYNPTDSIDRSGRFGYGSYRITKNELIETIEYGDIQMMQALDTLREFRFELQLTKDTYSQISTDELGNRTFSENYVRID